MRNFCKLESKQKNANPKLRIKNKLTDRVMFKIKIQKSRPAAVFRITLGELSNFPKIQNLQENYSDIFVNMLKIYEQLVLIYR